MRLKQCSAAIGLIVLFFTASEASHSAGEESRSLVRPEECEVISVKVSKRIRLPKSYHEGLFLDGKNIWVANGKGGNIWVVDRQKGAILSEIKPISTFTEGITLMPDNTLCVTDWDEKKVYRAVFDGVSIKPVSEFSVAPAHPAGVVWTGSALYVITWTRGMGTRFDILKMTDSLALVDTISIQTVQEPAHMAWDGKNLWISSWYNKMAYRVDVNEWRITGVFHSPVSDTTGIVWDKDSFWVTGTHGDLYQLKLSAN